MQIRGENILIEPASKVSPDLKAQLRERKAEILESMRRLEAVDSWEWIEERAAIMEIDGGLTPEQANCKAFIAWFNRFVGDWRKPMNCDRCGRPGSDVLGEVVLCEGCLCLVVREWKLKFERSAGCRHEVEVSHESRQPVRPCPAWHAASRCDSVSSHTLLFPVSGRAPGADRPHGVFIAGRSSQTLSPLFRSTADLNRADLVVGKF